MQGIEQGSTAEAALAAAFSYVPLGAPLPLPRPAVLVAACALLASAGCTEDAEEPMLLAQLRWPLAATCTAQVVGVGAVDTETDYLPHVVACENGAADYEALKAQAVAARSVLYYKMATAGQIRDGTSDQVYTCDRPPRDAHRSAVAETVGQVITYRDTIVFGFYVAGAIPSTADCVPAAGDPDRHNTERYVTYNWGRSGGDVEQTTLGWVNPGNHANRGCKSQNGAHCLAEAGWGYRDILNFYYGMDLALVTAEGDCVSEQGCTPEVVGDEVAIDDRDGCFVRSACESWREESVGHAGHLWWTYAWDQQPDCTARWRLSFAEAGDYRLEIWVEAFGDRSRQVPYRVRHDGQESEVVVSQEAGTGWLALGRFSFAAGGDQWVELSDATGEPYADRRQILVDALRVRRAVDEPPICVGDQDCADPDACNGQETCRDGACLPGEPLTCQDDDPCTADRCEPARGCVFEALPEGTSCGPGGLTCQGGACLPHQPGGDDGGADGGTGGETDGGTGGDDGGTEGGTGDGDGGGIPGPRPGQAAGGTREVSCSLGAGAADPSGTGSGSPGGPGILLLAVLALLPRLRPACGPCPAAQACRRTPRSRGRCRR